MDSISTEVGNLIFLFSIGINFFIQKIAINERILTDSKNFRLFKSK